MSNFYAAESQHARLRSKQDAARGRGQLYRRNRRPCRSNSLHAPRFSAFMILWKPMLWTIELFAVVALEGQVDLEPTPGAFQTLRLPDFLKLLVSSSF